MNYQHTTFLLRISVTLTFYAAYDLLCVTSPKASIHGALITQMTGQGMLAKASFLPQPAISHLASFHFASWGFPSKGTSFFFFKELIEVLRPIY